MFLRVVIAEDGTVDALDQLDDQIRPGETAYVYRMVGHASHGIACSRGHGCRRFVSADYRLYESQPPQNLLADNERWADWAMQAAKQESELA